LPAWRVVLLRLAPDEHVVVLTIHHIIADAWSIGVLVREISVLYPAFQAVAPSPLPALPVQYVDYAVWQRQALTGEALSRLVDYWPGQLRGSPSLLELPSDHPRPAMQTYRGARTPLSLPADLSAALRTLARQERCTPFMVLLAAFQVLLHRYTGQRDIVVGTTIANRDLDEI